MDEFNEKGMEKVVSDIFGVLDEHGVEGHIEILSILGSTVLSACSGVVRGGAEAGEEEEAKMAVESFLTQVSLEIRGRLLGGTEGMKRKAEEVAERLGFGPEILSRMNAMIDKTNEALEASKDERGKGSQSKPSDLIFKK